MFDSLAHAAWAGRAAIEDAVVLDAFAGTGALGLEALSRGAARATFMENDRAALDVLRANIGALPEALPRACWPPTPRARRAPTRPAGWSSWTRPTARDW